MEIVDKVKKILQKNTQKHLVFYFDEQAGIESFEEELTAIANAGIQITRTGINYFKLKYQLEFEWAEKAVFIYNPFPKPEGLKLKKYPLLDLLLANNELRLDNTTEFLAEYGLQDYQMPLVKRYIKYLKIKSNQKKLASILDRQHFNEDNLQWGLIAILLDFNSVVEPHYCVAKWLGSATDKPLFNKFNQALKEQELDKKLLAYINNLLDVDFQNLDTDSAKFAAAKLKYNLLTFSINKPKAEDVYARLKITNKVTINRLHIFYSDWVNHPHLKKSVDPVFEHLASEIIISKVIDVYGINHDFGYYSAGIISRIIANLYDLIAVNPLKTIHDSQKWINSTHLGATDQNQSAFIYHTAQVFNLLNAYNSFSFSTLDEYIREYTSELYKIDQHYRLAVVNYEMVSGNLDEFEKKAQELFKKLNQRYDLFVKELNVEWQQLLNQHKFELQKINIKKQFDFYKNNIKDFDYKIVVIISDAFRYELGQELTESLLKDNKNTVNLELYLASVPSYTNLGMTNLLPHDTVTLEKEEADLAFKINGISTTHQKRKDILQQFEPSSNTLKFDEAIQLNQEEGRKFFKENRIIYIYHDWIDAVGDKKKTEYQTFEATSKALADIQKLIKKLFAWNIYHVLITADHGFLFNYSTIKEINREEPPKAIGYQQLHSRFMLADNFDGKIDGYKMNMSNTSNIDTDLKIALPRAVNRYKKQGNIGLQFAHGGASLQELLIPVIKLYRQKKETGESVSFKRIDDAKKIVTGSIKVTLLQDQPVSNQYKSLEIVIGLYSETGEHYSDEMLVHLDSTSASPRERIYEPILNLNSKGSKATHCYLKAFEKSDKNRLNPIGVNDLLQITSLMEKDF